ncbi:hypothetical protein CB1_002098005 [Camelus ferus]|nr:hypothetical protein CB1_002098005 [Camelus ferus]
MSKVLGLLESQLFHQRCGVRPALFHLQHDAAENAKTPCKCYDAAGPVAIGLTHWKNPYAQGRPTLPSDLPFFVPKDAGIPVYHRSLTCRTELATPLSCPASLSITPVPSYSSSSQETLSQDTTGVTKGFKSALELKEVGKKEG